MPSRQFKPDAKALKMATRLLDAMAANWKPAHYHDTYAEELHGSVRRTV